MKITIRSITNHKTCGANATILAGDKKACGLPAEYQIDFGASLRYTASVCRDCIGSVLEWLLDGAGEGKNLT